ncbi:MAG: hypothetical protein NTX11_04520 [Candidatus Saccharibacteria bacterium]|nr:hypothetical protein [Candidatus Saccharibacteria bacterium]
MKEHNTSIGETRHEHPEASIDTSNDISQNDNDGMLPSTTDISQPVTNPLASSELSLDELVPRTWKKW